jgi:predicted  nucleic acid-binding Zn-ribbon protein
MSETHHLLEITQKKVLDLETNILSSETRYKELQNNNNNDIELKKQYIKLQEVTKNDKEKLAAFEHEGQILAKKQSDMEKEIRKTKTIIKEKDIDIMKLKDSREQLMKAIEEMQELVRKNETEASNATKSLNAMQAVSHASTDKLAKLENELASKINEILSQRTALETAWSDNGELKRALAELKADRDDLRKQLGEGNSKVIETESSRRDVEQREAVLRATNKQLQDSLQRQMQEANTREERLQNETTEMRKRWHDAITSRDNLAAELGSATTPLLRQISTLQESLRIKGENWQSIEISLSERALRAESTAEIAQHKKLLAEDQLTGLKHQISILQLKLTDNETIIQANEGLPERLKKIELMSIEKANEFESKLSLELAQKQNILTTLREIELRYKYDQQENIDNFDRNQKQHELRVSQLNSEIDNLREKLSNSIEGNEKYEVCLFL